jgi:tetratricopeptide (TPR) repeat protein
VLLSLVHIMSVIPEPRLLRIRTLQRAYSALQQDLPYLEERINLLRAAVSSFLIQHLHQPDVVLLAQHHRDIGAALYDRYMHLRDLKDLEEAETHLRLALSETNGSPSASFPGPSHLLGSVLRENASQRKNAQVATEALALHREPFAGHDYSRASTLQQAHYSRELGLTLVINYLTNSTDVHVLSESIRRLEDARSAFATMHVSDHISYLGICRALNGLCAIKLEHAQMEDAITYGRLALTLCGHAHRDLFWVTQALSNVYIYYTWSFDNVDSLNTAISLYREALSSAPPRWASLLTVGLLNALDLRYDRTHREEDLMEATTLIAALIIDSSPADEAWARLQNLHANFLYRRFQTTGVQNDIDAAVHAANAAVSATAIGTPHYPNRMQLVAGCRIEQYKAFGDVVHLNEAIGILEHTVQTVVLHSAFWMDAASELLEGYHHRYGATGDVTDLNRAICLLSALRTTHEGRVKDAPLELYRVGYAFLARFATTGALKDLDQATMLHQEAAAHASAHYHTHKIMGSYASTLRVRYVTLGEEESVVRALDMQNKAVAALSEVHPDRPEVICGLAQLHLSMRPSQATVSEALDLLLDALSNNYCPAYKRFKCVSDVLRYLNTHRPEGLDHLENALKLSLVYSTIIALLPQVASFGLEPRARLAVMTGAGQLTIQGAVHAISMVKLDEALEMLEAGRSVFWTQGLRLRTPFTDLLRAIGDQLTKITYALSRPPLEGPDKDHELSRRRKLGDEFQAVLAEARLEPGFEDLLRNASFEVLARAASHHPVVVLVAGDASGHAVIVSENAQCILVGLPRATNKALRALATHVEARVKTVRSLRGMRRVQATDAQPHDVYKQLWTLVMRPIVEALKWPVREAELLDPS